MKYEITLSNEEVVIINAAIAKGQYKSINQAIKHGLGTALFSHSSIRNKSHKFLVRETFNNASFMSNTTINGKDVYFRHKDYFGGQWFEINKFFEYEEEHGFETFDIFESFKEAIEKKDKSNNRFDCDVVALTQTGSDFLSYLSEVSDSSYDDYLTAIKNDYAMSRVQRLELINTILLNEEAKHFAHFLADSHYQIQKPRIKNTIKPIKINRLVLDWIEPQSLAKAYRDGKLCDFHTIQFHEHQCIEFENRREYIFSEDGSKLTIFNDKSYELS